MGQKQKQKQNTSCATPINIGRCLNDRGRFPVSQWELKCLTWDWVWGSLSRDKWISGFSFIMHSTVDISHWYTVVFCRQKMLWQNSQEGYQSYLTWYLLKKMFVIFNATLVTRNFLSGMMGRYNYKMPMEFLEKDFALALCYQLITTQQTTKMAEFRVSNDLTSPHKKWF